MNVRAVHDLNRDVTGNGRSVVRAIVVGLLLDAGLSYAAYVTARLLGATVVTALLVGAGVSVARVVWGMARSRRVEGFAVFMAALFAASAVVSLIGGDTTFMLAKESFVTGAAGMAFLITARFGKPLSLVAAQKVAAPSAAERAEWDALWVSEPIFKARFRRISMVVGAALLLEALTRIVLVYTLPADTVVSLSGVLFFGVVTAASIWAVRYARGTQQAIDAAHRR